MEEGHRQLPSGRRVRTLKGLSVSRIFLWFDAAEPARIKDVKISVGVCSDNGFWQMDSTLKSIFIPRPINLNGKSAAFCELHRGFQIHAQKKRRHQTAGTRISPIAVLGLGVGLGAFWAFRQFYPWVLGLLRKFGFELKWTSFQKIANRPNLSFQKFAHLYPLV